MDLMIVQKSNNLSLIVLIGRYDNLYWSFQEPLVSIE